MWFTKVEALYSDDDIPPKWALRRPVAPTSVRNTPNETRKEQHTKYALCAAMIYSCVASDPTFPSE